FFFFFSSRRRHTRLQGDWSSDVCSSDLKGGGKPFGPTPRKYTKDMPREMRRQALRAAVAAKIAAGELSAVETLDVRDGKTKSLVGRLAGLGVAGAPTLLVVRELDGGLARAARNVRWI